MYNCQLIGKSSSFKDIDFAKIDKVSDAFCKLFSVFQQAVDTLSESEFRIVRNACIIRAQKDEELCKSFKCASNGDDLFRILAQNCNWMCVEYLSTVAYAYGKNDSLINLIKNYCHVIFSKPLREVWNFIPFYSVKDEYYSKMTIIFKDKDPDDMTVEELYQRKPKLAEEIAMLITNVKKGSLMISWLIPTSKVYQTYLSFLAVPQHSRKDTLVKIGNWKAYLPQYVVQEQQQTLG